MIDSKQLALILTFALAAVVLSYPSYAGRYGWPTGATFLRAASWTNVFGIFCFIGALVVSFLIGHWWHPLLVFIAGSALAHVLLLSLKMYVQPVALFGLVVMCLVDILYVF